MHPISLCLSVCQFVSPFRSFTASHLLQTVRTLLGTAGWESAHCWDSSLDECVSTLHVFSRMKVRFSSWSLYHRQTGALRLLHGRSLVLGGELHLRRDQWAEPAAEQPSMVSTWKPTKWRHHQKQSCVLNLLDSTCFSYFEGFFVWENLHVFSVSQQLEINQSSH